MNQVLVGKNVLENIIKKFKEENRPAAEIKIHQDALDRTNAAIAKNQASLDSMTKKARKDVENAKTKLDNFINKERVKENQVIQDAKYSSVDAYLKDKHDSEFKDKVSLFNELKKIDIENKKLANIESLIKQRDELIKSSGSTNSSNKTETLIQIALSTSEKLKTIDNEIQSLSKERNDLMIAHKLKLFLTDFDIKQSQDLNQKLDKLQSQRLNESAKIIYDLKLSDKPSIKTLETIEKLANLETRIKKEIYELSVQNILTNSLTTDGTNKYTGSLEYLNKPDPIDSHIQDNLVSKVVGLGQDSMPSQTIALKASEAIKIPTVKGKETMDASVFKRAVESVWEKPSEAESDPTNADKKKELLVLRDKISNASSETERNSYQKEFDQKNAEFMKNDPATQATLRRNDPAIVNQGANKGMSVQTAVVIQAIRDMGLDNFKPAENLTKDQLAEFKKIKEWIAGKDKNGNLIDPQYLGNQMATAVCKIYAGYSVGVENGSIKVSFGEFLINKFRNADVAFDGNSAPILDQNRMRGYDNEYIKRYDNNDIKVRNDFGTIGVDSNGKITGVTNPISVDGVKKYLNDIPMKEGDVTLQIYGDTNKLQGGNHYFVVKRINGEWYDLNNNGERDPLTGLPPKFNYGNLQDGSKEIDVYGIFK